MHARTKRLKKAANARYERLLGGPEKKKKEETGQSVLFFPRSQLCVRRCVLWYINLEIDVWAWITFSFYTKSKSSFFNLPLCKHKAHRVHLMHRTAIHHAAIPRIRVAYAQHPSMFDSLCLVVFITIHPQEGVLIVLPRDTLLHHTAKDRDGRCLAQS